MRLTDISVRRLKPTDKQVVYYDSQLANFGVRVGKKAKTFIVKLGKTRTIKSIGRCPEISLSDARQEAMLLLATGPVFHSKARYLDVVKHFLKHCKTHNRPSTVKGYDHYLNAYDTNKRVSEIERSDVQKHLEQPENRLSPGDPAFEFSALVCKLFEFCISFSTLHLFNIRIKCCIDQLNSPLLAVIGNSILKDRF